MIFFRLVYFYFNLGLTQPLAECETPRKTLLTIFHKKAAEAAPNLVDFWCGTWAWSFPAQRIFGPIRAERALRRREYARRKLDRFPLLNFPFDQNGLAGPKQMSAGVKSIFAFCSNGFGLTYQETARPCSLRTTAEICLGRKFTIRKLL